MVASWTNEIPIIAFMKLNLRCEITTHILKVFSINVKANAYFQQLCLPCSIFQFQE